MDSKGKWIPLIAGMLLYGCYFIIIACIVLAFAQMLFEVGSWVCAMLKN
jgi:hypothetical protein